MFSEEVESASFAWPIAAHNCGASGLPALIVRAILTETKAFVESAPKSIKSGITKDEANTIKAKLAEVGAKFEIK